MDIIGDIFAKNILMFNKLPWKIQNSITGQSLISINNSLDENIKMKDIETNNLEELLFTYRALTTNIKTILKNSTSNYLILDLTSEFNKQVKIKNNYFNFDDVQHLNNRDFSTENISLLEHLEIFKQNINEIITNLSRYKSIFLLIPVIDNHDGVTNNEMIIQNENMSLISKMIEILNLHLNNLVPLHLYQENIYKIDSISNETIEKAIKKIHAATISNNDKIIIDEYFNNNTLYAKSITSEISTYEIYKDGKLVSERLLTNNEYIKIPLNEKGTFRLRLYPKDDNLEPKFTLKYEFRPIKNVQETNMSSSKPYILSNYELKNFPNISKIVAHSEKVDKIVDNPLKVMDANKEIVALRDIDFDKFIDEQYILQIIEEYLNNK